MADRRATDAAIADMREEREFAAGLTAVASVLERMGAKSITYGFDLGADGKAWFLAAYTDDGSEFRGISTRGATPGVGILEAGAAAIRKLQDVDLAASSSCGRMCHTTPCDACPERQR